MAMNKVWIFDALSVDLPEKYEEISQTEGEQLFWGNTPELIYKNKESGAVITFTRGSQELTPDNIQERLGQYYYAYQRTTPGFKPGPAAKKQKGNVLIGSFEYLSTWLDKDLFNMLALIRAGEKEAVMTMHCDMNLAGPEGANFMLILSSVNVKE